MKVAVPREIIASENRVALIPNMIPSLKKEGMEVIVESDAGAAAFFSDAAYLQAGATIENDTRALYEQAHIILKVRNPTHNHLLGTHEIDLLHAGQTWISLMDAYFYLPEVQRLAERQITCFAMDFIPRITRAQSMDALSSMAATAGYRAVLTAATELPKYFPMLTTAAGTITPAKVFVIGAGVAGLMAIATAKRLGAVVEAYDTRPEVKEQVESLGAKFVEFDLSTEGSSDQGGYAKAQSDDFYKRQQEQMTQKIAAADVVITTAAIPGKPSPRLITDEMLQSMKAGSVVVDLATERGGNVEGSLKDQKTHKHGITIIGYIDHPARLPVHASQLYSKNMTTFLTNLVQEGQLNLDLDNEILASTLITHQGKVTHEGLQEALAKVEVTES